MASRRHDPMAWTVLVAGGGKTRVLTKNGHVCVTGNIRGPILHQLIVNSL